MMLAVIVIGGVGLGGLGVALLVSIGASVRWRASITRDAVHLEGAFRVRYRPR